MELIQKYLHGELTPEELAQFQKKLKDDPAFVEEVEAASVLLAQYKLGKKQRWQKMLDPKEEQAIVRPLPTKRRVWIRRIAAAVCLLLIGSFGYWYFASGSSLDNLVASYVGDRHVPPSATMGSEEVADLWQQVREAYLESDFTEVVQLISLMQNKGSLNAEQHFYLGLAHLYANTPDYEESIQQMTQSANLDPVRFGEQADWYRSLAYLTQGKEQEARSLLTEISKARTWHFEEAERLLEKIKN